jgi:hypothetical protein
LDSVQLSYLSGSYCKEETDMAKVTRQIPRKGIKKKTMTTGIKSRVLPLEVKGGIKFSLYGVSGKGKTRFISTWPKPLLLIDCNAGIRSIATVQGIERLIPEKPSDIDDVCNIQEEEHPWKTVVLDHATSFQDLVMTEVLGLEEAPVQLGWGTATQQQYGVIASGMKDKLRRLLALADDERNLCNVAIVAQEREFEADEGAELLMPYVSSAVTPSVVGYLQPAVDYIAQMFVRRKSKPKKVAGKMIRTLTNEMEYCLRTGPHPVYSTKFRVAPGKEVPEVIVNPTFKKMLEIIS